MDKKHRSISVKDRAESNKLMQKLIDKQIKYKINVLGHARPLYTYYFTCGEKDYKELKGI